MMLNIFLTLLVIVPFMGFLSSLFVSSKDEVWVSRITFYTVLVQLILVVVFIILWIIHGAYPLNLKELTLYHSDGYDFVIDFYFDKISAVYLSVGALVTFIIVRYSAYYMHMEAGYKRFFNTILFFFLAYNFTVLSGNFETLFLGWELLGISSFLLVAFYRERYLPVRNAVKVFSIYRIGDVGILLAIWASHHLWHENVLFIKLGNYELVHDQLTKHSFIGIFISICLLVAASAKSAQFPFSSWLPRAMEGPTPSSAIFYGSLSVHFGVFLLLRTFPFWEHQLYVRILIALSGLVTAVISFFIAKVQSTIKAQIAYASISQIGIMFIEIALGLETLVLIHFTGNAFLRTYQLLISPSVVSYKIRDQLYHFVPEGRYKLRGLLKRLEFTFYVFSLKEWGLESLMKRYVFSIFKKIGHRLDFINQRNVLIILLPLFIACNALYLIVDFIPVFIKSLLPGLFAILGMLMVFKAFAERQSAKLSWILVFMNHLWVALAVSFNEQFDLSHIEIYLSGIIVSAIVGHLCIHHLQKRESANCNLNSYYGHVYEYPKLSMVFLISALGMMGFPITLSFVGEDLIFSHIRADQYVLAFCYASSFILGGIALIRIYARLFLGPHIKKYHETALPSS